MSRVRRSSPRCAAQAQAEAARITESAKKQIEAERQQAVVSLRGEVGRCRPTWPAASSVSRCTTRPASGGIVDRFLAELEAGEIRPETVGSSAAGASRGRRQDS